MHEVTHLKERHTRTMQRLEKQQELSEMRRRKEEEDWDQAYFRAKANCLLGEAQLREPRSVLGGLFSL